MSVCLSVCMSVCMLYAYLGDHLYTLHCFCVHRVDEIWTCGSRQMLPSRQTDRQTNKQTQLSQYFTSLPGRS